MLTEVEKKVISIIQDDIQVTQRPYLEISKRIGVSEDLVLDVLRNLVERGIIRRFGATLRHQKSGFSANAMVAWQVDELRVEEVGNIMASFHEVTHCYGRNRTNEWPYNLYTMVHAKDRKECRRIAEKMAKKASVETYILLFSNRELKKTSMKYFSVG